jgi:GR25 family glycosyltransferase involved in LPS biosynthesis
VVISLPRSAERRAAARDNLDSLDISFSFFDAVDGRALSAAQRAKLDPRRYIGQSDRELTPGEIGCAASYHILLSGFAESDGDYLCIAEDDCCFTPAAPHFLDRQLLAGLPDFDVLRLMRDKRPRSNSLVVSMAHCGEHQVIAPLRPGFLTTAQIFSRAGARKVADAMLPLRAPFDNFIYRDISIVGLRVLEVTPPVVTGQGLPSAIGARGRDLSRRPVSVILRRKLFLLGRRLRAPRSFVRAWGWRSIARLRRRQHVLD